MRKKARSPSLYGLLVSAFLLCLFVVLVFIFLAIGPRMNDTLRKNALDSSRQTVWQGAASIDQFTDEMKSRLSYAAGLLPLEFSYPDYRWQWQFDFMVRSHKDLEGLALFRQDGRLVYATQGSLRERAPSPVTRDWFSRALRYGETVTVFSPPAVQALFSGQKAAVISIARAIPLQFAGKTERCVLLMDVSTLTISGIVNDVRPGTEGYAFIIGENDELLFHPRLSAIHLNLAHEDLSSVSRQIMGSTAGKIDGRERLYTIALLKDSRWRLVGTAQADDILHLQSSFFTTLSVALVAAAILSLGLFALVGYLSTRPITQLSDHMEAVSGENLEVTIPESGFAEVRKLTRAFTTLMTRIRALMSQIVVEQEKKRLYELNALQAQINPHFLYNTLDSIVWMQERGKNKESVLMVTALAKLFRISISRGRDLITVGEELEHVRNYLFIQQMRFKDRFTHTIHVADEAVLKGLTLKLIVQPMVENALNHAMSDSPFDPLHIDISAQLEGDDLLIVVSDDGRGIPEDKLTQLLSAPAGESGIGIKNVHERIQLSVGSAYGLTIISREDEGTKVIIRQPWRLPEDPA